MKIKWTPVTKKLPPNPKSILEVKSYLVSINGHIESMIWADGWNCYMDAYGNFFKEHEIKGVDAWADVEPYEVQNDLG